MKKTQLYFLRFPVGLYMLALSFSSQFCRAMWFNVGGASVTCALMVIAMVLCTGRDCRRGFFHDMVVTGRQNANVIALLSLYYLMVVISWFHAPYYVEYEDWGFIWKTHVVDILEIAFAFYLCRNPKRIRLVFWICLLANLVQFSIFRNASASLQISEARGFLKEFGYALGGSGTWQGVAMFFIAFVGYLLTEERKVLKYIGLAASSVFPYYILRAGFATPVALLFVGFLTTAAVYFKYGKKTRASGLAKVIVFIGAILIVVVLFVKIVREADNKESKFFSVAERFSGMVETTGDVDVGHYEEESYALHRTKLMDLGFKNFLKSPIWGLGGPFPSPLSIVANDHQALIDYLAHFGLIGGGSHIIFILVCFFYSLKRYKTHKTWQDAAAVGVVAMYFFGGVVNPMWYGLPLQAMIVFALPFKTKELLSTTGVSRLGSRGQMWPTRPIDPAWMKHR